MEIRHAERPDLPQITALFNYYIEHTNARFEEQAFSVESRKEWFNQFSNETKYQIFVAYENDIVIGFACSQPYRDSTAFSETVETSIYIDSDYKGRGVGKALYRHLFANIGKYEIHRALSGIALPNEASIALHEHFGFKKVGTFDEYAKKHGQYISSAWYEKTWKRE